MGGKSKCLSFLRALKLLTTHAVLGRHRWVTYRFMQKLLFILLFLILQLPAFAQKINKYWVEFKDKNNSPYCICRPSEFLSARALERRARASIEVVENDLPVNPDYLHQLKIKGVQIHNASRWLNAAAVMADSAAAEQV